MKNLIKNPNELKPGDKVKLRDDVLVRHARSVPAHLGYTKEQFAWRKTLSELKGKIGTVERVFEGGFITVRFDNTYIGIEYTELVKVKDTKVKKGDKHD